MSYRGIYRDGYVKLEGEVDLRNGSTVEVHSLREVRAARASKPATRSSRVRSRGKPPISEWERAMGRAKKMTKKERIAAVMASFGAWKDRPEWKGKSSAQIASELRKRAASRARND